MSDAAEARNVNLSDKLNMLLRGEIPPPPIAQLIGFTVTSIQPGWATVEFQASERHANPMGTLHGGVLCDIADAAMGMAYASTLAEDESFTTLELKINFLKVVRRAKLKAIAQVIKRGKTIGMAECEIVDEKDQLIAKASCTQMTLRGEMAQGR